MRSQAEPAPHVFITPPRTTYLLTVWLPAGHARFCAYHADTSTPAEWLRRWEENWLEVAADLWDYSLPEAEPAEDDILAIIGRRQPVQIRRRV